MKKWHIFLSSRKSKDISFSGCKLLSNIVFFTFISLVAVTPGIASNLLTNSSFETGDFTGWNISGTASSGVAPYGTFVPADYNGQVNARSGEYAAYGIVKGYMFADPTPIILSQTISVAPNQTLAIGFYASNWSASDIGAYVGDGPGYINIYVNGNPILPATGYFTFYSDQSWVNFDGTFNNGATTTITVDFKFLASGLKTFPVSLDDFYVQGQTSAVPIPAAVWLLGSGLVGLVGLRRKIRK